MMERKTSSAFVPSGSPVKQEWISQVKQIMKTLLRNPNFKPVADMKRKKSGWDLFIKVNPDPITFTRICKEYKEYSDIETFHSNMTSMFDQFIQYCIQNKRTEDMAKCKIIKLQYEQMVKPLRVSFKPKSKAIELDLTVDSDDNDESTVTSDAGPQTREFLAASNGKCSKTKKCTPDSTGDKSGSKSSSNVDSGSKKKVSEVPRLSSDSSSISKRKSESSKKQQSKKKGSVHDACKAEYASQTQPTIKSDATKPAIAPKSETKSTQPISTEISTVTKQDSKPVSKVTETTSASVSGSNGSAKKEIKSITIDDDESNTKDSNNKSRDNSTGDNGWFNANLAWVDSSTNNNSNEPSVNPFGSTSWNGWGDSVGINAANPDSSPSFGGSASGGNSFGSGGFDWNFDWAASSGAGAGESAADDSKMREEKKDVSMVGGSMDEAKERERKTRAEALAAIKEAEDQVDERKQGLQREIQRRLSLARTDSSANLRPQPVLFETEAAVSDSSSATNSHPSHWDLNSSGSGSRSATTKTTPPKKTLTTVTGKITDQQNSNLVRTQRLEEENLELSEEDESENELIIPRSSPKKSSSSSMSDGNANKETRFVPNQRRKPALNEAVSLSKRSEKSPPLKKAIELRVKEKAPVKTDEDEVMMDEDSVPQRSDQSKSAHLSRDPNTSSPAMSDPGSMVEKRKRKRIDFDRNYDSPLARVKRVRTERIKFFTVRYYIISESDKRRQSKRKVLIADDMNDAIDQVCEMEGDPDLKLISVAAKID